jgi:hypothetical protein
MKQLLVTTVALLTFSMTTFAQGGPGGQRMTLEERVKMVMDKLTDFKLDKEKTKKTEAAFTDYYTSQQKMREEMMGSGTPPDRDAMREKMQGFAKDRDEKLKAIFTEEQFKKWKDEIEPSLRPQRPGGGGNN